MKKILKNGFVPCFLAVLAGVVLFTGCEEKFKWDLPLSLSQRAITLGSSAGSTHVLVYSTGDWSLSFTDPSVTWATVDRIKGSGNGEFVFSYTRNYDFDRKVGVVVTSGSLRDTVVFTQAGEVESPTYSFAFSSVELLKSPETISIPVTTNTTYRIADSDCFSVTINYYDKDGNVFDTVSVETKADGDDVGSSAVFASDDGNEEESLRNWIRNVEITAAAFIFDVTMNPLSYARKAYVSVRITSGTYADNSSLTVSQTTASPVFVLDSTEGEYNSLSRSVTIPATYNNISLYADRVVFNVTYSGGSDGDWIQSPSISESGLSFSLSQNNSGAVRNGVIAFSFTDSIGNSVSGSYSVTQNAE